MKLIHVLSHPITQVISFCIILISGPYFGGPYGFYLYHALQEGLAYAILGVLSILLCLLSLVIYQKIFQLAGTILMILSLIVYFRFGGNSGGTFREIVSLLTLFLFIVVVILVTRKTVI